MSAKPLLNMLMTTPGAVQNLVQGLQMVRKQDLDITLLRMALYPPDHDTERRWDQVLDAAEALGLLANDRESVQIDGELTNKVFGRVLRECFRAEELDLGPNSLLYIAYRAALELPPASDGGTATAEIIDRAEDLAFGLLGATDLRRFQEDKMRPWRWWMTAAGLGFPVQRVGTKQNVYVICPVAALRDELFELDLQDDELPLADFFVMMENVPLWPLGDQRGLDLPVGTGAALRILDREGVLKLIYRSDARREWRIPGRPAAVTHVSVLR